MLHVIVCRVMASVCGACLTHHVPAILSIGPDLQRQYFCNPLSNVSNVTVPATLQALPSIEDQDGAFTRDLVISNNTIDAVFGGVFVGCLTAAGQVPCPARGHSNLTVAANLIQNAATLPLLLTSARTVSVAGNVFRCVPFSHASR